MAWKTKAFSGWTLNGNFSANSGMPLTALLGGNLTNSKGSGAVGQLRADATGQSIDAGNSPYFNLLAFTLPVAGQYGNAGVDTIPGIFTTSLNASLNRAWRFGEIGRQTLQLRLSANNAMNHVQITGFGTTVNSATYGLATARLRHAHRHAHPEVQLLMRLPATPRLPAATRRRNALGPRAIGLLACRCAEGAGPRRATRLPAATRRRTASGPRAIGLLACRCAEGAGLRRATHLTLALLLTVASSGQQQQSVPVIQDTGTKFTTEANLVIVDVTVKDPKTGQPIEGLKASDFTLLEDNKPQKISTFEFQKLAIEPEPPEPPPSLEDQRALPEDPKTTITVPSRNQIQYHDKRLIVLFFDFSNMGIPEQLRAQDAALHYINTQMTESDLMAILTFTTAVQVKTDFTANRDQLTDIVKAFPIGMMSEMADTADTGDDNGEDTGAAFVADETEFNIFNTDQKLAAIEDAVKKLAQLPEKKVLVYITNGISKTGVENQAQLEASINAAVRANVAIYPIDARGLMADPPGGGASKAASRGTGITTGRPTIRSEPKSTIRRRRFPLSPPKPAAKYFSIPTTYLSASSRPRTNSRVTTFSVTTRLTPSKMANIATSTSS